MPIPTKLQSHLDLLGEVTDRESRIELLHDLARRYEAVPKEVATRPYDPAHRVPACDSEAYVWWAHRPDGGLDLFFAVENPQGVTAQALAGLLQSTVAGAPTAEVAALDPELVETVFGPDLTMAKRLGLANMVAMVRHAALHAMEGDVDAADDSG